MTQMYAYMAVAIFAAVCAAFLKKKNPELSLVFGIGAAAIFVTGTAANIGPLLDQIKGLSGGAVDDLYFSIPLKVLGISILGKITCSICEDAGEKGISTAAGLVAKISSLMVAMPLFEQLTEQIRNVML